MKRKDTIWMLTVLSVLALVTIGCRSQSAIALESTSDNPQPTIQNPKSPTLDAKLFPKDPNVSRVLVVINENSSEAVEIGEYYVRLRQIPPSNVLRLKLPVHYRFPEADFDSKIASPIRTKIKSLKSPIDFIVTTRGFPLAFVDEERRYSVDAWIMAMDLKLEPMPKQPAQADLQRSISPYLGKAESFSSKKYGFYLVTRLDGYSVADCKKLVDNSLLAKPEKGPFVLDGDPTKPNDQYTKLPESLTKAGDILSFKKYEVNLDNSRVFTSPRGPVMGYVSWGSNDASYDKSTYRGIRFKPGAIAETFVSWSARRLTFEDVGQSLIGDLIQNGVTGVKGYVSEPYSIALARPDILFDRYTGGFNLAESFYMASPLLKWKDVVIGDPLCSPYRRK